MRTDLRYQLKRLCHIRVLFTGMLLTCLAACNKKETSSVAVPYDSSKPVEVTSFMPDSGGIKTKFVIKGSNFGNDKSKISVYFKDVDRERKAVVIGVNSETI